MELNKYIIKNNLKLKIATSKKYISIILYIGFLFNLNADDKFSIYPKMDLFVNYESQNLDYSSLGQLVNGVQKNSFSNSIIGGDIGFGINYNNFDLVIKGSGISSLNNLSNNNLKIDSTYFDNNNKEFFYLSNLYLQKNVNNFNFRLGRQEYSNQLVNRNKKIISNQYEGIYFDYAKDNFKIDSMYFKKVAASTISNVVPFNHDYGVLGYGKGFNIAEFVSVSKYISNKEYNTDGALITNLTYGNERNNINLQNLYVDDFFNTTNLNLTLSKEFNDLVLSSSLGFIKQVDVGENYLAKDYGNKKIDGKMYQGSLNLEYKHFFASYTRAKTPYNTNAVLNGTIISPFSNELGWICGPQTSHSFIADTVSNQFLIGTGLMIFDTPSLLMAATIDYEIDKNNIMSGLTLHTKEKYIYFESYISDELTFTIQYSDAKNIDLIEKRNKNLRSYINYKF